MKLYLYSRFERFWHWAQALLVLALIYTGLEIHGTLQWLGYERAVVWHNRMVWALVVLVVFAIFWHFTTGQWRQYLPTRQGLGAMVRYYIGGVFRNEPHPTKKTELTKLNPLQRLTYLGLKIIIFPIQIGSGLLYYFYNDLPAHGIHLSLGTIAALHMAGTFALIAFAIVHIYLTTTGHTLTSNIKAMFTGEEEVEGEGVPDGPAAS